MIHRADAGGVPQPLGRGQRGAGIQNHAGRANLAAHVAVFDLAHGVYTAAKVGEFCGAQGGGNCDLPIRHRFDDRRVAAAVRVHTQVEIAQLLGPRQLMRQRDQHDFHRVNHGTATDGDDQVRVGCARCVGSGNDAITRRVLAAFIKSANTARAQRRADFCHHVGLAVQRSPGHDKQALGGTSIRLFNHSLRCGLAPNHAILREKFMVTCVHGCSVGRKDR